MSSGVDDDQYSAAGQFLTPDAIDLRVAEIETWIDTAGDALATFFIEEKGGFRRSTLSPDDDSATSTCRALLAMAEERRVKLERGADVENLDQRLSIASDHWIVPMSGRASLEGLREKSGNKTNAFTDAQLLSVASLTPSLARLLPHAGLAEATKDIGRQTRWLAKGLAKHLIMEGGGSMEPKGGQGPVHDFITMHAARGIDAHAEAFNFSPPNWPGNLPGRVEARALGQLAYYSADVLSRYDPAELLFSAALLRRFEGSNCIELTRRAVAIAADGQTDDGAWPSSRIVSYENQSLLHVASYEVALTMATIAYSEVTGARQPDMALLSKAVVSLERSMRLVRSGYVTAGAFAGWANDRTRWEGLIEGWATAIVLLFLVRYREVLLALQQRRILDHHRASRTKKPSLRWPELDWTMRVPSEANTDALGPSSYSDPTDGRALSKALVERVLHPIALDPIERPSPSGASLLLYGAPGTRKTSLVKLLARCLDWPVVTLAPPSFLSDGGLEGFEAAADRIFRDLMRLRRCVVLFDECEDFFKPRNPVQPEPLIGQEPKGNGEASANVRWPPAEDAVGSRTIGAFLTAGMLPRLQDLRDRRWIVFVLATNSGLDDLDPAVIRPGRFDFAQRIDNPTVAAQIEYAMNHRQLGEGQKPLLAKALEKSGDDEDHLLPFAVIDEVARDLAAGRLAEKVETIQKALTEAEARKGPPSLLSPSAV